MTEQTAQRRVIVGVDGSPAAQEAVRFAAHESALRGATVVAVMAVELPDYAWIDPYAVREHPEAGFLEQAEDRLRAMLAEIGTGGVPVQTVVSTEPAPAALVAQSVGADLLVVGSRARGGFRGMLMGSVSLQCVLHAHCPVTVVRPEPGHRDEPAAERNSGHTLEDARRETTPTFR
ncbi:MAG TPA: universal stress protein [Mycobacteriales bacterium]|nr:universal stress protein [Mycobacteriales bacterium]